MKNPPVKHGLYSKYKKIYRDSRGIDTLTGYIYSGSLTVYKKWPHRGYRYRQISQDRVCEIQKSHLINCDTKTIPIGNIVEKLGNRNRRYYSAEVLQEALDKYSGEMHNEEE